MTRRTIAVVSAGLGQPSSTRLLADRLAQAARENLEATGTDVTLEFIELRELAHDVTNNLLAGFPSPKLARAIETVAASDGLIAVTPIFTASYSGLFKSFIDVFDPHAVTDLPVLIAATGGTERHSLALDHAMRPLFSYLHAVVAPTAVFAASSDWGRSGENGSALPDRIARAGAELAALVAASRRSETVRDPFELDAAFGAGLEARLGTSVAGAAA